MPEWLARFPWPDLDGEGWSLPAGLAPPFGTRVIVRSEARRMPVRQASQYLGTVEVFGPRRQGTLSLTAEGVAFAPEDKSGGWQCPLVDLAAIQPASSTIQLRARGGPVVSLRFPEGSVRLWEQRLKFCTRAAWSDVGRGEIAEFQPRIRTR